MEGIFTFRLMAEMESEHKRTRYSCVRGRKREVAKQGRNYMWKWKVKKMRARQKITRL